MQKNHKQVSEKSEFELLCLYMDAVARGKHTQADYFFRYYCQTILPKLRVTVARQFYSHRRYSADFTQDIIVVLIKRINQRATVAKDILLAIQELKKQSFSNAFYEKRIKDWIYKLEPWLDEAMGFLHEYNDVNSPQLDEQAKRINDSEKPLQQEASKLTKLDLPDDIITCLELIDKNLGKVRIPSSAIIFDAETIKNKIRDFLKKKSNTNEILGVENDAGSDDKNSFIEPTDAEENGLIEWTEEYKKNQNIDASESDFSDDQEGYLDSVEESELHEIMANDLLNTKNEKTSYIDTKTIEYNYTSDWLDKSPKQQQESKKINNCLKVPVFEAEEQLNKAKEKYSLKNNKTNASMHQKACDKLRKEREKYILRIRILKSLRDKYDKELDGEKMTDEQITKDLGLKNRSQLIEEKKKIKQLLSICPGMDVILKSYQISGKA